MTTWRWRSSLSDPKSILKKLHSFRNSQGKELRTRKHFYVDFFLFLLRMKNIFLSFFLLLLYIVLWFVFSLQKDFMRIGKSKRLRLDVIEYAASHIRPCLRNNILQFPYWFMWAAIFLRETNRWRKRNNFNCGVGVFPRLFVSVCVCVVCSVCVLRFIYISFYHHQSILWCIAEA